ncbi:MAG: succinate dehydrogenase / fumarate reductase, iron-sulfur subunit [Actinomycetota bacterium]|jgi:succinate dehydrogenase / fumarate reductase iron-sulfur subunit|nr:succinate dehydrogenase / fumarate reductase, iron-sulfur subunit [Actinomycetota bacterium]
MELTLRIKRFNPEVDRKPHWETYTVEVDESDRVLDALHQVKWHVDGTLSFRRSCAHGVCGSDAMVINGKNRLACVLLVRDVGSEITVEPIRGLPVVKDLVVDMEPFFEGYRSVLPSLITHDEPGPRERIQSPEERARFDDTTKCILCAACTTSCPVYWSNDTYVGPAAIVNAHRFIFDSRDDAGAERLEILSQRTGVWGCRTAYNCTDACPRGIKVTQAIQEVKRAAFSDDEGPTIAEGPELASLPPLNPA